MKKPWLAALLNLLPGLGYLYLGTRKIFAYMLLIALILSFVEYMIDSEVSAWTDSMPVTALTLTWSLIGWGAFVVDAYQLAKRKV